MNARQRIVLVTAALVVLVMLLFPPFQSKYGGADRNVGYHFILGDTLAQVNVGTLLAQWVGVAVIAGAVVWALKD